MAACNTLILLFIKDLRGLYRNKISLICQILLIFIAVPLFWFVSYKGDVLFEALKKEPRVFSNWSIPVKITKTLPFKVSVQKEGIVDFQEYDNFLQQLAERCPNISQVHSSENPDIIITVKNVSTTIPIFEYDLMIAAKNKRMPYHNEPYVIPNIFGDDSGEMNSGIPFSKSMEATTAQFCVDSSFYSLTPLSKAAVLKEKYYVRTVPAPQFSPYSSAIKVFITALSTILPLFLLIQTSITTAEICTEKENGIHRYMIVMGLPRSIFYLSHYIFALIKMHVFMFLIIIAFFIFYPIVGGYTFLLIYLLGHVFLGIVFIFSTIFKKGLFVFFVSIGYILLLFGIHVFATKYFDIYNSTLATLLSFLNPISAYYFGIEHLFIMLDYDQSLQFFTFWNYYLPFSVPIFCLLFHSILFILLAFYFDYVLPIDDSQKRHPLFFIGRKFEGEKGIEEDELPQARCKVIPPETPSEMIEPSMDDERGDFAAYFEEDGSTKNADIVVSKLVKKWSNDEIAVKNVSFKAYRDQVTALLGHNGAGKSTIFGILTGSVRATAGIVRVDGKAPSGIGEESNVGFCPQWDPLFPHLTVEEHLAFYGDIKTGDSILPEEIDTVLETIGLVEDRKLRGSQLSGGMKRKLCVGIAMIGESQVLLLDEPTAGIDTMARRTMLKVIEKAKEGRTILLTTHYMDEADFLSDRIIIMAKGEIVCNGSSEFLKARFATGFILTVDLNLSSESCEDRKTSYSNIAADILNVAIKHCDDAKIEGPICRQINIVFPYGSQRKFPKLFKEFERRKDALKIESFDVRVNSLEQVFIKVTEYADSSKESEVSGKIEEFIEKKQNQTSSCCSLFSSQFLALFIRKLHYIQRHYIQTAIPLILVLILLVLLILNATSPTSHQSEYYQNVEGLDLATYPEMKIFHSGSHELLRSIKNVPNIVSLTLPPNQFFNNISEAYYSIPPFAFGIEKLPHDDKRIYYRHTFPNGVPLALNLLANSRFDVGSPIKTTISIAPTDTILLPYIETQYQHPITLISVLIFPLVFCFPPLLHILEIHHGTLHLYQRTSMSIFTYWFTAFISDFLLSLVPIGLTTILIFAFGIYNVGCLFGYWISVLVISFAFLSQGYLVSNFIKNGTRAIVFLFCYNFILFAIVAMIVKFLSPILNIDISSVALILFPTYSLFSIFSKFNGLCNGNIGVLEPFEFCDVRDSSEASSCTMLGMELLITFSSGVFFTLILCVIAYWRTIRKYIKCKSAELALVHEDLDVLEEKQRIEENGIESFAICTKDLRKDYGGNRIAVKNLSIGIKQGECFGLLGTNGAGKSTTFNMLTAILRPTDGIGVVNGINIEDRPRFGFCPQKDALLGDLTVYETLLLFARLNGILDIQEVIECLMECLQLTHKRDNLAINCSGGELRRLSLAVALITNSDVIMLDEPTAGVDPRTRRHVWELLIALRAAGTSQLLTSHSMEECEALCTRIGFLNNGQLVGIGTSQYLKNRYGNTYMLSITMHDQDEPLAAKLNAGVQKEFQGTAIVINGTLPTLTWTIQKSEIPLSELYEKLIQFVDRQPRTVPSKPAVKDFALVGTSLDEVFIAMTKNHIVDIPESDRTTN